MQKMSVKVVKDVECSHAERMRDDRAFYKDWMLPKFQEYCDLRSWEMPPVAALDYRDPNAIDDDDLNDPTLSPRSRSAKKRNILYRGGHKVRKRIRQRKQKDLDDEIAALKLEGEKNSYGMPHLLNPETRERFEKWSTRKKELDRRIEESNNDESAALSKTEKLFESVFVLFVATSLLSFVVLNKFLGAFFGQLVLQYFGYFGMAVLYNFKFCFGCSLLYFLAFTAVQTKESRRRQTMFNTRVFGVIAITLILTVLTIMFLGGCAFRGFVEMMTYEEAPAVISEALLQRVATCQIATSTIFAVFVVAGMVMVNRSTPNKKE